MIRELLCIVLIVLVGGCAFIEPHTKVKVNPATGTFDVYNSKDTSISAEGIAAENGEKKFSVGSVNVTDNSSPVINANVQQILAFVQQQKAANEGIAVALKGITGTIRELIPFLNLTQGTMAAMLNQLKEVDMRIDTQYGNIGLGEGASSQSIKKEEDDETK